MKTVFTAILLMAVLSAAGLAQSPSSMNYQAIARTPGGALLQNADLSLRLSIVRGSADGDVVYQESHRVHTDNAGQCSLHIGEGAAEKGDFSDIEWYREYHWLRVEMDETGGRNYTLLGSAQLLSVPYAMFATQAGSLSPSTLNATNAPPSNVWQLVGNSMVDPARDFLGTTDTADLVIRTGNLERMRLTATGRVGIGTPAPRSGLDVQTNLAVGDRYAGFCPAPVSGAIIEGRVGIGTDAPTGKLTVKGPGEAGTIRIWPERYDAEASIGFGSDPTGGGVNWLIGRGSWGNFGKLVIGYASPNIVLQQDGRVGIGTVSPKTRLDVNGDVTIQGNITITGNTNVGGKLDVGDKVTSHSDMDVEGVLSVKNATNATSKDNGAVVVEGGVGIEKDVRIGGVLEIANAVNAHSTMDVDNVLTVKSAVNATSNNNGAVVVKGGVGIEKDVRVGGKLEVRENITAHATVDVDNVLTVKSPANATLATNGALVVAGGLGVGRDVKIGGSLAAGGSFSTSSLYVAGELAKERYVAWFENVQDDTQSDGIGIKIRRNETSETNNFISFYRGSGNEDILAGYVEGYKHEPGVYPRLVASILADEVPTMLANVGGVVQEVMLENLLGGILKFDPDFITLTDGSLPNLDISFSWRHGVSYDWNPGSLPKPSVRNPFSFHWPPEFRKPNTGPNSPLGKLMSNCLKLFKKAQQEDWKSLYGTSLEEIAIIAEKLEVESEAKDGGVVYGSNGADYAEWLPKANSGATFMAGQIVGVRAGKISLQTEGAEQIMSISMAPVVIGNVPPAGMEKEYEKVAFIGQVPVMVRGSVQAGDYVVASGRNDGFGIGVKPDDVTLEQLPRILGRSLTASTSNAADVVTVLIGVKTNEWVQLFKKQHARISELESSLARMHDRLASEHDANAQLRADVELIKAQIGSKHVQRRMVRGVK